MILKCYLNLLRYVVRAMALVPVLVSTVFAASNSDFAGTWTWTKTSLNGQALQVALTVALDSAGALGGTLTDDLGDHPIASPSVSGDQLAFQVLYHSPGSSDVPYSFTLGLDGAVSVSWPPPPPVISPQTASYSAIHSGAPVITKQPALPFTSATSSLDVGYSLTLTVLATSASPMTYSWEKNGSPIAGATSASLVLSNLQISDSGSYACLVRNSSAVVSTIPIDISVATSSPPSFPVSNSGPTVAIPNGAPTILSPPPYAPTNGFQVIANVSVWLSNQPADVSAGSGSSLDMIVGASGKGDLSFQWYKDGVPLVAAASASSFTIKSVTAVDAGKYSCRVTDSNGSVTTGIITVTVVFPPTYVQQPASCNIVEGQSGSLTASVASTSPVSFQWYHGTTPVSGPVSGVLDSATSRYTSTYAISAIKLGDVGTYYCTAWNSVGPVTSNTASVGVTRTARVVNLSTRAAVGGVAGSPIAGFVVGGDGAMSVLIPAVGPTLPILGVNNVASDPYLQLIANGQTIAQNDDWSPTLSSSFAAAGAFPLLAASKDAALVTSLSGGGYTAIAGDHADSGGVALLEVYDAQAGTSTGRLVNASTRAYVGADEQTMITGFVISGAGTMKLLIRAAGPQLAILNVPNPISDPQIALFKDGVQTATNDNWSDSPDAAAIAAASTAVGAFSFPNGSKDAALLVTLGAGAYTLETSGVAGAAGTALVELYIVQ